MAAKIHSVAKGKRSELYVMAVLLESGFKVFQPLADTEGIDCIVLGHNNKKFYPIQIKSRAEFTEGDQVIISHFTDDMFIIIYDVLTRKYWVIPFNDYQRLSRQQTLKDGTLQYRLTYKKNRSTLEKYEGENGIEVLEAEFAKQLLNSKGERDPKQKFKRGASPSS